MKVSPFSFRSHAQENLEDPSGRCPLFASNSYRINEKASSALSAQLSFNNGDIIWNQTTWYRKIFMALEEQMESKRVQTGVNNHPIFLRIFSVWEIFLWYFVNLLTQLLALFHCHYDRASVQMTAVLGSLNCKCCIEYVCMHLSLKWIKLCILILVRKNNNNLQRMDYRSVISIKMCWMHILTSINLRHRKNMFSLK